MIVPNVIKRTPDGERGFDIFSRLLDDRIILLTGPIDDAVAALVCAQLLYLDSEDSEKDISLYINSPGGSVSAGLAILDTMNFVRADVATICMGTAASMGAVLLTAGQKGKRFVLPNAEVMIHQPLGGTQGQASDMVIELKHMEKLKTRLYNILAQATGKTFEEINRACDRNNWMDADEAIAYGLADTVVTNR